MNGSLIVSKMNEPAVMLEGVQCHGILDPWQVGLRHHSKWGQSPQPPQPPQPAPKVPYDIYYADTFGTMLPRSPAAAKGETPLTAKQDVDRLIAEATDAHRLASMYEGWCPWL